MAMSEYETQKFLEAEQRVQQIEQILAELIGELKAAKVIKEPTPQK